MSFLSPLLKLENLPTSPIMSTDHKTEEERYSRNNVVAEWYVPVNGAMYHIELEHGTTSGRRMIWLNGKEVLRRDWMFKLVGEDSFYIDKARCIIRVDPAPGFKYYYYLFIDGKSHDQYAKEQTKHYRLWLTELDSVEYRVVLELDSLTLYINDQVRAEKPSFVHGGTDTIIHMNQVEFILQARSSGNKLNGIEHTLLANNTEVPEVSIDQIVKRNDSVTSG